VHNYKILQNAFLKVGVDKVNILFAVTSHRPYPLIFWSKAGIKVVFQLFNSTRS
jgi:hypothetical protein